MNRDSLATIEVSPDGYATWVPTPKVAALGFQETRLHKLTIPPEFFLMAMAERHFAGMFPDDTFETVLALNSSARAAVRADKERRKLERAKRDAVDA